MSFCAKTECEIYRSKRYCRKVAEKEHNGVCDCRHAVYRCSTRDLCVRANVCEVAPEEAKLAYQIVMSAMFLRGKETT